MNPLRPDHEGHYCRLAHEADRRSRAQFAPGKHPIDAIARSMAERETRRRFFLDQGEYKPDPALTMLTSEFLNLAEVLNK
jgi:hypothetical protein